MLRDAWSAECAQARTARSAGDGPGEWLHLERAHIEGWIGSPYPSVTAPTPPERAP